MPTNYDTIVEEYIRAKQEPWRLHIESYSLFQMVGDLNGKSVLDLACGEGFYSRALKLRGAHAVVGVDISAGMIDLARKQESQSPLGVQYAVEDVKRLDLRQRFDLVFAAYLLHYANSEKELLQMARTIVRHLKPGGRFIAINSNPNYTGQSDTMLAYGFARKEESRSDGAPMTLRFILKEKSFEITIFYMRVETYEWALKTAGLSEVHWRWPQVSPEGLSEYGAEYWADFLKHKPVICLECNF